MRRMLLAVGIANTAALAWVVSGVAGSTLKGEIKIDGSSAVYFISEAAARQFRKFHPEVNITVGIAGTGGGFQKFYKGEIDITDASRPIKPGEVAECKKRGIDYIQLQVAWHGLAVVINKENDWASDLTVKQLKKIWHPDTAAKKWSDVDASWPTEEIKLFGACPDDCNSQFFTGIINGKKGKARNDYVIHQSEDSLVQAVAGNKYALGYLVLGCYDANKDKLRAAAVKGKEQPDYVVPTHDAIRNGQYILARPLFIYVKKASLARTEVREFVHFYSSRCKELAKAAEHVPLDNRPR